ncbi:MAG: cellulase family glycosylhydrolase [Oligoflexus sp.]
MSETKKSKQSRWQTTLLLTALMSSHSFFAAAKELESSSQVAYVELIRNGSFTSSADYWKQTDFYQSYEYGPRLANSQFELVNEAAKITVTNRGQQAWHAHLLQNGIVLEKDKNYELSYWVKIEEKDLPEAPVTLVASLINDQSGVKVYFEEEVTITDGEWQKVSFSFTSPVDDDFVRLDLNYGRPMGKQAEAAQFILWLDDVSLIKTDEGTDPRVISTDTKLNRPVQKYGKLSVNDRGQLISQHTAAPVQLRGLSFHGIHWDRPWYYANREAMLEVKEKWGAELIRIPLYLGQGGYIESASVKYTLEQLVRTAIDLEMYVMIDWHVHNDAGDPNRYIEEAKAFFAEMAQKYGEEAAVIFEISNEPNGVNWDSIKRYADQVVPVIRQYSDNIIVVGTPVWSQEVQTVIADPIQSNNIMYTFHFYAASHPLVNFRAKIEAVLDAGLGLFVTEFGSTSYGGNGQPNLAETQRWLDYLDQRGISWVNWTLSAEHEESAILKPTAFPVPSQRGGWSDADLTESGLLIKNRLSSPSVFDPDADPIDDSPIKLPSGELKVSVEMKNDWGVGYCSDVIVRNETGAAVTWLIELEIEGQISSSWNASWSQKGSLVKASGTSDNAVLASGGEVLWGFCAAR